jgi:hypothetical protein
VACDIETEVCRDGACVPACDAEFCPDGCCDGRACIIGDRNAQRCGTGGAQCAPCSGDAQCVEGVCRGCDAVTCPNGCCQDGECVEVDDQDTFACGGAGGNQCVACRIEDEVCRDGVCVPACDAEFCPDGCCDGRACIIGDRDEQRCGSGGAQCAACPEGEICNAAGVCEAACGPDNCNGCCSPQGTCVETQFQNEFACGQNGGACAVCSGDAVCVNGACEEPGGGGECACSTPGATVGPALDGCPFGDANECTAWQSVIIGSENGNFTPEEDEEALNRVVPDGTIVCAFDICCLQITCP